MAVLIQPIERHLALAGACRQGMLRVAVAEVAGTMLYPIVVHQAAMVG